MTKLIQIHNLINITESSKEIDKILILNYTHNLVCSYEEKLEISELMINKNIENKSPMKLNSLQNIIEPNFNTIEYLYETKQNSNNKNYLLLCSDMIHVYYLYDNDKKSMLLQSINQFNFQYISQVIEKRNGNIISLSNEYKISIFKNNLIENDEIIDYNYIFNKGDTFVETFKDEIYELEKDKLNKDNEKIYYILEIFPDKLVYVFRIENNEFENEIIDNNNINNVNDEDFIYIKFLDNNFDKIKELKICNIDDNFHEMFQYNEKIMVFINDDYLYLIDLKYYEVVTKIMTNKIIFSKSFQKNADFLINNYFNYILLGKKVELEDSYNASDEENSLEEVYKFKINDLTNIMNDGKQKEFECKGKEKDLNFLSNIHRILEISFSGEKDNNNIYYCVMLCLCKNTTEYNNINLILLKFEIQDI